MYFIGQRHIMRELQKLLPYLYETGEGHAILFRGPSGWGKTRLALQTCNYLSGGKFGYYLGDKFNFQSQFRVHFIDEVHLLQTPETLYPLIDSGKYVFVLATNDAATLLEALVNRCTEFIFSKYSVKELREICRSVTKIFIPDPYLDYVIESGGGNPRVIRNLLLRLNIILYRSPNVIKDLKSLDEFKSLMEDSFGIVDGMDVLCSRYMEALTTLGGTASLQTLSTYLHVDQNSLRFYAEPVLLYKNKIKITHKGRSLV